MAKRVLLDSAPENRRIFTCDICNPTSPMETTTAAVTVKITSISERLENTTFADAAGSGMAILLWRQSYFHAPFGGAWVPGATLLSRRCFPTCGRIAPFVFNR